jgi:hypothetical protein
MITIDFVGSTKSAKKYKLALNENATLAVQSKQLRALIMSAVEFGNKDEEFTLEQLAQNAVDNYELSTRQNPKRIGEWHRPKLIELGVISEA